MYEHAPLSVREEVSLASTLRGKETRSPAHLRVEQLATE